MKILFSPIRSDETLNLVKEGDVLTINEQRLDFTDLADGEAMPAESLKCPRVIGQVRRVNGQVEVMISLPHTGQAPDKRRFPRTRVIRRDGPIKLPGADEEAMAARKARDEQSTQGVF